MPDGREINGHVTFSQRDVSSTKPRDNYETPTANPLTARCSSRFAAVLTAEAGIFDITMRQWHRLLCFAKYLRVVSTGIFLRGGVRPSKSDDESNAQLTAACSDKTACFAQTLLNVSSTLETLTAVCDLRLMMP